MEVARLYFSVSFFSTLVTVLTARSSRFIGKRRWGQVKEIFKKGHCCGFPHELFIITFFLFLYTHVNFSLLKLLTLYKRSFIQSYYGVFLTYDPGDVVRQTSQTRTTSTTSAASDYPITGLIALFSLPSTTAKANHSSVSSILTDLHCNSHNGSAGVPNNRRQGILVASCVRVCETTMCGYTRTKSPSFFLN